MSKQKNNLGKKADSWGKPLEPIFKFASWIHKHRIYRIMIIFPALKIKIIGRLFGTREKLLN